MKRFYTIVIFLLASLGAFAATGGISGKVANIPTPKALPGAFPAPPTPAVVFAVPLGRPSAPAHQTVTMDQKWTQFMPGVLAIPVGATVRFKNNDTVKHDVMWRAIGDDHGLGRNLGVHPPGQAISFRFTHPGAIHILCTLHPGMSAWIYVAPTPYTAVTKSNGQYALNHLPAGRYRVSVWHPGFPVQSKIITVSQHNQVNFKL